LKNNNAVTEFESFFVLVEVDQKTEGNKIQSKIKFRSNSEETKKANTREKQDSYLSASLKWRAARGKSLHFHPRAGLHKPGKPR